jgi:hypothetical protein
MPQFRQGSQGHVPAIAIPPVAGSRAGTTNPAAGLSDPIDARGYKSGTLRAYAGVVAVSTGAIACKVQSSATANGATPADIAGAAIAGFGPNDDNTIQSVDFAIPAGRPYLVIVETQSQATDVGCAWVELVSPMSTSRV